MKKKPDNARSGKPRGWEFALLGAILLAGALLRGAYLREIREDPEYLFPSGDTAYHEYWARGIATGKWFVTSGREDPQIQNRPFYRPPGYAYFLAGIYRVCGLGPLAPRVAQAVLGLAAVAAAWALGRRWFGPAAGILAAAGLGLYWVFIYYEGELLGESAAVLLGLVLLGLLGWAGEKGGGIGRIAAGLGLGLLALLRPNAVLLAPFLAGWLIWMDRRRGRGVFRGAAVFLLGALLPVGAASLRNWLVAGELVPVAANAGVSIAVANNDLSDGTTHVIPGLGDVGTPFDWPVLIRKLERDRGIFPGDLSDASASSLLVRESLDWMRRNPGKFLRLLGRKALLFWGPEEVRNVREDHFARLNSRLLSSLPGSFPLPAALALLGTVWLLFAAPRAGSREWDHGALLLVFFWGSFLTLLPFAVAGRYRVPLVPAMFLLGGCWLEGMAELVRRRQWRSLAIWAAGAGLLAAGLNLNLAGYRHSPEKWHYDRGLAYSDAGKLEEAAGEFEQALRCRGDFYQAANNLGNIRMFQRDFAGAELVYRRVLEYHPSLALTRSNLGNAIYNRAVAPPLAGTNRGEEMVLEAIGHYRQALKTRPDLVEAQNNLGVALVRIGRIEEGTAAYREALRYRPGNVSTLLNLGEAYRRLGQPAEARSCYLEILRLFPGHPVAAGKLAALGPATQN